MDLFSPAFVKSRTARYFTLHCFKPNLHARGFGETNSELNNEHAEYYVNSCSLPVPLIPFYTA